VCHVVLRIGPRQRKRRRGPPTVLVAVCPIRRHSSEEGSFSQQKKGEEGSDVAAPWRSPFAMYLGCTHGKVVALSGMQVMLTSFSWPCASLIYPAKSLRRVPAKKHTAKSLYRGSLRRVAFAESVIHGSDFAVYCLSCSE
jgi:hypothetical protein